MSTPSMFPNERPGHPARPYGAAFKTGAASLVASKAASAVLVGLAALMAAATSSHALTARECRTSPLRLVFDARLEATMLVRGGVSCSIKAKTSSAWVDELVITLPPALGTVAMRGRTGVIYRPGPGSRGADVFEFAVRGKSGAQHGTMTVRVLVSVQ